jgi:hypothetical protein
MALGSKEWPLWQKGNVTKSLVGDWEGTGKAYKCFWDVGAEGES